MRSHQTSILLLLFFSLANPLVGIAQTNSDILRFNSKKGLSIVVEKETILVNGKKLYKMKDDDIIYKSKRNQLIEDAGSVFLFLEVDGRPNLDRLYAFEISDTKVHLLADAISSDLKDLDGDGYLEFGGRDLTEDHPSEDSMYYIPFDYYEIRKGMILYDSAYSKKKDIEVNGVFLLHPSDARVSGCCTVIVKPGLKKIPLVNPLIISERIDGPANIRDTVKGRPLFVLNDNIPVSTSDTIKGWCRVGLTIELTDSEYTARRIPKAAMLLVNGLVIGKTLDDLDITDLDIYQGKKEGILRGYTAIQNIKTTTLPENILARLVDQGSYENSGISRLKDFIKGFRFSKSQISTYITYQLDEGAVYGPSSLLRLALVFNGDELFAVVHRRKMPLRDPSVEILNRGYYLSVITSPSLEYTAEFVKQFNAWIK